MFCIPYYTLHIVKRSVFLEGYDCNCRINLYSTASCAVLPAITVASGNVTLSTNGSVTFATYNCPTGYVVNGASTLSCGSDGTWSEQPSDCGRS